MTRAIQSALNQSFPDIEIIVVIDGPDDMTRRALEPIKDNRLRVRTLPYNIGLGGAINAGVREAKGDWIALLDDDDEWMAEKLELQLNCAGNSEFSDPIICCRILVRTEAGELVWPRYFPSRQEPLSEYLFCQKDLRGGGASVLPSGILTTRRLMENVPWRVGLPRLNDFDWLLRVSQLGSVGLEFVPGNAPLVVYHREEERDRIGNSGDWKFCRDWLQENRHLITDKAYSSFLLTVTSMTARRAREWRAFWILIADASQKGLPRSVDLLAHLIIWLVPWKIRTRLSAVLDWKHRGGVPAKRGQDRGHSFPGVSNGQSV